MDRKAPVDSKEGPGPEYDDSEIDNETWMHFVAHGLTAELIDPREDIYSLEDGQEKAP